MVEANDQQQRNKKHQGGKDLLDLDHSFEGYDHSDVFQWELSVQMYARGATTLTDLNEVGKELCTMVIKLQTAHGKGNFKLFNEHHECIELETFPTKAAEVQKFLNYENIVNDCKCNVSFLMHITGLVQFRTLKNKIFHWLYDNQVWLVHQLGYQDGINNLLDKALDESEDDEQ
eukprot:15327624-Ditylum_brightwellii.AAC.1